MKKLLLIITVLISASLACAAFQSLFSGDQGSQTIPTPTTFPTLAPATPTATKAPTATPIVAPPTLTPTTPSELGEATTTTEVGPTATLGSSGETSNFFTCVGPCLADGSNSQDTFPERTTIVYFQFDYQDFPVGASYTRWWTRNGVEWARYQCQWPGPESGLDQITLTEPNGLPSGTWQVTITIDGVIVLQKSLVIEGTWNYWDPAGFFGTCYGKR